MGGEEDATIRSNHDHFEISDRTREELLAGIGTRDDGDKVRHGLIPADALDALARLYTEGAKKYSADNYLKGMAWMRLYDSMRRHEQKWLAGETFDPETGAHHMIAAAWNCIAVFCLETRGRGEDDRPEQLTLEG